MSMMKEAQKNKIPNIQQYAFILIFVYTCSLLEMFEITS